MSKLPLYKQIVEDLKEKILTKELATDQQIPTELELSNEYGVSRITSKRALTELENEGLIYRIQGKGSFVKEQTNTISKNETKEILFILPFPNHTGLGDYTQGIAACLQDSPYQLNIQPNSVLTSLNVADIMNKYTGLILYPLTSSANMDLIYTLKLNDFPVVVLDKQIDGIDISTITADNFQGGYLATKYLIELGHEKIAFLSTHQLEHTSSVRQRYLGYLKALQEEKLSYYSQELFLEDDEDQFFQEILADYQKKDITAVVAEHDLSAILLMKTANKSSYPVPAELSVIGFDNIQAAALVEPPLSTISQNFEQIGFLAAQTLIKELEGEQIATQNMQVPVQLIKRQSTQEKAK